MIKNLIGVMLAAMLFIGLPGIFIQSREESTSRKIMATISLLAIVTIVAVGVL